MNIPLWLNQFPTSGTKVTISSPDIPYIKESVLHLYSLGIHEVNINVVYEDVWKEGDDLKFEEQLLLLADEIIDNGFYKDYVCSFFSETIGKPMDINSDNRNWCGAGRMLSIDAAGNFYPCTRFAQYSLRSKSARVIGNINDGIDKTKYVHLLFLTELFKASKSALNVMLQVVVDGVKEKTMIYQKLAQLVKEVLPFVRCIRLVLEQIIIIGINYIGS